MSKPLDLTILKHNTFVESIDACVQHSSNATVFYAASLWSMLRTSRSCAIPASLPAPPCAASASPPTPSTVSFQHLRLIRASLGRCDGRVGSLRNGRRIAPIGVAPGAVSRHRDLSRRRLRRHSHSGFGGPAGARCLDANTHGFSQRVCV
jgi:hypothetical protein